MTAARMTAGLAADFGFVLAVAYGWRWLGDGSVSWWLGALVGVTAFTVTALVWPPPRRGRHRCR